MCSAQVCIPCRDALFVYTTFRRPQHSLPWDSLPQANRNSFTGHSSFLIAWQSSSLFVKIIPHAEGEQNHSDTLLPHTISSKHTEISLHLSEIPAEQVKQQCYMFNLSFSFHLLMQVYTWTRSSEPETRCHCFSQNYLACSPRISPLKIRWCASQG